VALNSLSEYGCNKNTRKFEEVAALYGSQMTPVYSGGLVYEYSQEEANYGLVDINGGSVTERDDFAALQSANKDTPIPTGDGGYKSSGSPSTCPAKSTIWEVQNPNLLPNMPAGAQKYMTSGAGTGPGNNGNTGSQTAGGASSGWSTPSGTSGGSSSSSKAAAASVRIPEFTVAPFVCAAVLLVSSMVGGAGLLL
jgi:hypothetical protein